MKPLYLSVIIPLYNEEKRLEKGLTQAISYLKNQSYTWEIVLVDDGSTDDTVRFVKKLVKNLPHQLLIHTENLGKGAAVRTGMLAARGQIRLFTDVDLSTPLTEAPKLISALKTHDVAIGIRRHPKAHVVVHQPKLREFLGHIFTRMTNILLIPEIHDATCGFKACRAEAAEHIFSRSLIKRWAFDAEALFIARKRGLKVAQIPVVWADNPATKVHMLRDGVGAFVDLGKIRLYDLLGNYR